MQIFAHFYNFTSTKISTGEYLVDFIFDKNQIILYLIYPTQCHIVDNKLLFLDFNSSVNIFKALQ